MQLDYDSVLQMVKVKDLQQFAVSIIEIMVGKCHRDDLTFVSNSKMMSQNLTGDIPLDSIPLNWSKLPQTKHILQIIQICFGPYNNFHDIRINTCELFAKITHIAAAMYKEHFYCAHKIDRQFYVKPEWQMKKNEEMENPVSVDRMKSMKLNNKAVFKYLSITEDSTREQVQNAHL